MTDLQIYIIFSLGCFFALIVLLFGNNQFKLQVIRVLKILLTIKILLSLVAILILPFFKPNVFGRMPFPGIRRSSTYVGIFFIGVYLTYLLTICLRKSQKKKLTLLLSPQVYSFDKLFRWAMAGVFIWSGTVKLLYPDLDAHFFLISGYSNGFLAFITAVEILGGIGLLFPVTALYASAILIANMAGATFTHYHNYFFRNTPDPFSNSIPSLSLQPFLITILVIAIFASKRNKKKNNSPDSEHI
jgi:uncharacterized membrane protein YphA (DoxX/SURF4 family)